MYKKHKWISGLRDIFTFNQLRQICDLTVCFETLNLCLIAHLAQCKLTGMSFEITYVSYTNRRKQNHKQKTMILSILLSIILIGLGLIHFNWAIGGKFGMVESLPTKESGERVLNPKKIDSAIVGIGLTAFGIFYILKSGLIEYNLPEWIMKYGSWIIPIVFLLRAIGEFKYVGFFKSVKQTDFGKLDTKLFSPLCLIIGIVGMLIQLTK